MLFAALWVVAPATKGGVDSWPKQLSACHPGSSTIGHRRRQQQQLATVNAALGLRFADRAATLEQQLRAARRASEERASELAAARDEAGELRAAKEAAVVEREAAAVRGERAARRLQGELSEVRAVSEGLARKARGLQVGVIPSAAASMGSQLAGADKAGRGGERGAKDLARRGGLDGVGC